MKKLSFNFPIVVILAILSSSCGGSSTPDVTDESTKPAIKWVSIPAGTFMMGSPASEVNREDNEIQHEVKLSAFKMSAYEVTFEQYDAFCVATKREKPSDEGWGRGKRPVINVSWNDATAFAKWVDARLPTEAEWEYACRAGSTTPFNTGANLTTNQANYDGNYPYNNNALGILREQSTAVGSFAPNAYGLYDMHGNVWEFCRDWYGEYPSSPQTNPIGSCKGPGCVYRGGSYIDVSYFCRSAMRFYCKSGHRDLKVGFRLVSPE